MLTEWLWQRWVACSQASHASLRPLAPALVRFFTLIAAVAFTSARLAAAARSLAAGSLAASFAVDIRAGDCAGLAATIADSGADEGAASRRLRRSSSVRSITPAVGSACCGCST